MKLSTGRSIMIIIVIIIIMIITLIIKLTEAWQLSINKKTFVQEVQEIRTILKGSQLKTV